MTEVNLKFLEGDFEILEKLGKGGMGQVFKARQKSLDRLVAIKILPTNLCKNEEFIGRFKREARLAGKFYHPNAIQVFDIGENHGQYYYIMEYVDGGSLKEKLNIEGKFDQAYVLNVLRQVLSVLKEAETMKIIHRDIKPDNIMLTSDGIVKLADLGLAREVNDDAGLTQQKIAIGTPHYMAPEQAQGKTVDMRADQYALGVTAFHMLTGRTPFNGKNNMEILVQHVKKPMPKPSSMVPEITPYMDKLIAKMTEKDPKSRFQSIDDIIKAVGKVADSLTDTKSAGTSTKIKSERTSVLERRRESSSSTGIFIFLALILGIVVIYFFIDLSAYTNPFQSIREDALYKVGLMEKEKRYEECSSVLKDAIKKLPTTEQDVIIVKLNEIETILANNAIDKIFVTANDSAENCERGIRELDVIIAKYGKNASAAKTKKDKLLDRISQIKAEEKKLLDQERDKNRDEKVNKLSLEVNQLTVDKKFKAAYDLVKAFKEKNTDSGAKVTLLADNISSLETEYMGEVLDKSNALVKSFEYDKSTAYLKSVRENLFQKESLEKVDELIKLNPKLKADHEKETAKLAKQTYQQTRDSIFALLKIAEIKAAKLKLDSFKGKNLSDENYDFFAKVIENYGYIHGRIVDGLSSEFKEQLFINKVGNKNIDVIIRSVNGGVIQYTFADSKLELNMLSEDWAPTYTLIAYKVTRVAKPARILQLCHFAYVNGDIESANALAKEAESLGLDKAEAAKYTKVVGEEYLTWLDIQFDHLVDKTNSLISENNKTRAKQIINEFIKRYSETVIYKERKKEIDELLAKIGG